MLPQFEGERMGLVESGSGKSSLGRLILGWRNAAVDVLFGPGKN